MRLDRGQQSPVNPVPGHQFGGLGGECLGLGRGHAVGLGLGEQLAHPLEQRGVGRHGEDSFRCRDRAAEIKTRTSGGWPARFWLGGQVPLEVLESSWA
jgi:hypothetical protein